MPKVSVIVPVYNVEKYLGGCLDSLLGQTLKDLEIICVNDGSTDGSAAILAEYAVNDSRIKVITQRNAGLSAARNVGMDVAAGEYIYFIDSDDWIVDDAIERCVRICERDNLDQLIFGCRVKAESDAVSGNIISKKEAFYKLPESICGNIMDGSQFLWKTICYGGYYPSVPLRLIRRSALVRSGVRFPLGLLHEDEYFTLLLLVLSKRTEAIDNRFYIRRLRAGSIMMGDDVDSMERHIAHTLAIYIRLKDDTASRELSRTGRIAVSMALNRLYTRLVSKSCRGNVSVYGVYHIARRLVKPNEMRKLAWSCVRLLIFVMANKSVWRLRKLVRQFLRRFGYS